MIVRQVGEQDWQTVRTARLAALAGSQPGTFATLLEEAQDWDEQHWRAWAAKRTMFVAESDSGVIGCVEAFPKTGFRSWCRCTSTGPRAAPAPPTG